LVEWKADGRMQMAFMFRCEGDWHPSSRRATAQSLIGACDSCSLSIARRQTGCLAESLALEF